MDEILDEIGDFGRTKNDILDNIFLLSLLWKYWPVTFCRKYLIYAVAVLSSTKSGNPARNFVGPLSGQICQKWLHAGLSRSGAEIRYIATALFCWYAPCTLTALSIPYCQSTCLSVILSIVYIEHNVMCYCARQHIC